MTRIGEIILHIGLEKTGSTSIQQFIAGHADHLARQGVVASQCLGWHNHKLLAAYGCADGSSDIAVTSMGIDGPDSHRAFRAMTRGHVMAEVDQCSAQRYLITSEDLSRLYTLDNVGRIQALLAEICDRVRIVVFVRRQDLLARSRHGNLLIGGALPLCVLPDPAGPEARYYDYDAVLAPWVELFGAAAITLVRFADHAATFDAVAAFCASVEIALPVDLETARRRDNISLDAASQLIVAAANRLGGVFEDKLTRKRLTDLLVPADGRGGAQLIGADEACTFMAGFADSNRRLAARFGLTTPLFGDDFSMYPDRPQTEAAQAAAIDRLVGLLAGTLGHQPLPA